MTWWLLRSKRLASEKSELADLEGCKEWLTLGDWSADSNLKMSVSFEITHNEKQYLFEMLYPSVFPDSPPMVFTQDKSRISGHQYGEDGELCLEFRPDNWNQSITGADMIASCYRLLEEEHPNADLVVHARSAHVDTIGRTLRSKFFRFMINDSALSVLNGLELHTPIKVTISEWLAAKTFVSAIQHIELDKPSPWSTDVDLTIDAKNEKGIAIRIADVEDIYKVTYDEMSNLFSDLGLHTLWTTVVGSEHSSYILFGNGEKWHLSYIYGDITDKKFISYSTVKLPPIEQRLHDQYQSLNSSKVGIVGCGSVGSKIAASLGRSGVGEFLLVDEDIFFPGNIVRNDLDLSDMGSHKAYSVKDRILNLNPQCDVKALRISLGGQESSQSFSGTLEALGKCDVIIDATAEPLAFNMIASVAVRTKTPMVWCQIFAGGIGGYICRSRPEIDPTPISIRNQVEVWFEDQDMEWPYKIDVNNYEGQNEGGEKKIADDAEVSVIAAHAARFVTDILCRPGTSIFPSSAYVVGLSAEWIFSEPFDTRPIQLVSEGTWGEQIDPISPDQMIKLLKQHLPKKR